MHRDVKPGNVLIASQAGREHVYLSDFGLTKQAGSESGLTQTGQFMGTVEYVAPEQIQGGTIDGRTDQYALACVLFECLTGEVPFGRESAVGSIYAHLEADPPAASKRVEELPVEIDGVFARGMAKDPEDRCATAGELAEDARSALGLSGEITAPVVVPGRSRRRLLGAVAVVAVVVAVAAVVAVLLTGGGDGGAVGDQWSRVAHDVTAFGGSEEVLAESVAVGESGLLVAVGSDGDLFDERADAVIWTSPDGLSWTRVRDSDLFLPQSQLARGVTSWPGGFVAVGSDIDVTNQGEPPLALAWTSPYGESWEHVVMGEDAFGNDVVTAGPGLVAVGSATEVPVWTSPDGQSWAPVPADAQAFGSRFGEDDITVLNRVAAAEDGRVVAVGWDGLFRGKKAGAAWLSPDGVSWTRVPHDDGVFGDGSGDTQIEDVVAGGPGFVAVGVEADFAGQGLPLIYDTFSEAPTSSLTWRAAIWTSADGLAWSRVPVERLPVPGEGNTRLFGVTTGGPGLVAVGVRTTLREVEPVVWTSANGETWTPATELEAAVRESGGQLIAGVVAGGPGLVAVGADGSFLAHTTAVWTSP